MPVIDCQKCLKPASMTMAWARTAGDKECPYMNCFWQLCDHHKSTEFIFSIKCDNGQRDYNTTKTFEKCAIQ